MGYPNTSQVGASNHTLLFAVRAQVQGMSIARTGRGRWEVGGTQPLCPSGPSMSLMRQSHVRGILTS